MAGGSRNLCMSESEIYFPKALTHKEKRLLR